MRRAPTGREIGSAALFFVAATILCTWPIAARFRDGLGDVWDAKLNAWILHWDFHQFFRDPLHLFEANIFYPAHYALAFSENLFGAAVFAFPMYAAGASTLTAYNVVFLLGMFLSAMAAWALAREVTGDAAAALAAGMIYAFSPWRIAQIPHIQFQWGAFLALSLLFLLRYLDEGRRRDLVLFGICLAWNALVNVHYTLFSAFLLGTAVVYEWLLLGGPLLRKRLVGCAVAAVCAAVVVTPFYVPYAKASSLYGMARGDAEIEAFSGTWSTFLNPGAQNRVYAALARKFSRPEGEFFPGLTPLLLATLALAKRRTSAPPAPVSEARGSRRLARTLDVATAAVLLAGLASLTLKSPEIGPLSLHDPGRILVVLTLLVLVRLIVASPSGSPHANVSDLLRRMRIEPRDGLFLSVAVVGVVVALGVHTPYYRFLVQSFGPVFHTIRAPARGIVLFQVGLAILAAQGLSRLTRRASPVRRAVGVALAILLMIFEFRAFPVQVTRVERSPGPVYQWLATLSLKGAVMEWPFNTDADPEYEFRSTAHWNRINNGYSGFAPPDYIAFSELVAKVPIPDGVWERVDALGARLLVFHPHGAVGDSRQAYVEVVRRGLAAGRLLPLRLFPHAGEYDAVFWFGAPQTDSSLSPSERAEHAQRVERYLSDLATQASPPFGVIDSPQEGASARVGEWGFGWALDDSGVARVLVTFDRGAPTPAAIGMQHPGVAELFPSYPDAARSGFGFIVPPLPPGEHVLTVTIFAKDGGHMALQRPFRIR